MNPRPPRLAVALLERFASDNGPLAGDLLEEWHQRSNAWFWRQILFVVVARATWEIRMHPRRATETALVAAAMLALLGFQAVVAASLMSKIIVPGDLARIAGRDLPQGWPVYFAVLSFAAAVLIGRVIGRCHGENRIVAILACSASATLAAFLNLLLFVPTTPWQPFFPHAATQIAVAMVCIAGLFAGIGWRSICEPLPSS